MDGLDVSCAKFNVYFLFCDYCFTIMNARVIALPFLRPFIFLAMDF